MFFISPAFAQAAEQASKSQFSSTTGLLIQFGLVVVIFYFLLIRPQQKRMKSHREMIQNIKRGDEIVTSGGIIGKVIKSQNENELLIEIADGVRVKVVQSMIANVLFVEKQKQEASTGEENKK